MANVNQMLREYARDCGIRLDIVEKDYAISYLLAAIADTPTLGKNIILKGGTALKKLYYRDYRFSEDLDYSTLKPGPFREVARGMQEAVSRLSELLMERGPFEVSLEALTLRTPHPGNQAAFLVRIRFPGQREALCRLKVEITVDEPVLLPAETRPILHGFDEQFSTSIDAYSLTEIVAEKLRALLQSQAHLADRGWGGSRACRDYYDLWSVLKTEGRLNGQIPSLIHKKCKVRSVTFHSPEAFFPAELQAVARREWNQQLAPFVPTAPPVDRILAEVRPLILALWE